MRAKHQAAFDRIDDAYFDVAALADDLAFAGHAEAHRWHLDSAPPQEQDHPCPGGLSGAGAQRSRAHVLTCYGAFMRRFVVIGQQAGASNDFSLDDLPGSSGRLDVLLRCVRAALLVSHGVRRDVVVYLVFLGGRQPRVLRFDGAAAKFVRPDERSLATLVKKALAKADDLQWTARGFVDVKAGIASASGGLADVIADLGCATPFVLDENGADVRDSKDWGRGDVAFFVGDHKGFGEATRTSLAAIGARPIRVGPVSLHAEDAIAVVSNEIDRGAPVQASV